MPFTVSHVAAVVPLLRTPLVPSALVLSSMAPDVPYYLPQLPVSPSLTHSVAVRRPLRQRASWRGAVVLYLSVVVGAATHVFWDSFTHYGRWGSRQVPGLLGQYGPLSGARWLQYASGLFGLLVLAGWAIRWWRRTRPEPGRPQVDADPRAGTLRLWAWSLIAAAGIAAACLGAVEPLTLDGGPTGAGCLSSWSRGERSPRPSSPRCSPSPGMPPERVPEPATGPPVSGCRTVPR